MVDKLIDKMKEEARDEKKAHRAKERDRQKRIKAQLERLRMAEDISTWKIITQVKEDIIRQLAGQKETKPYNIKHIAAIPDYYEYQHPDDTKKKTNSKDAEWVKAYLTAGGTEKAMKDKAAETRVNVWRRVAWRRPKKETTTTTATPAQPKNKVAAGLG